MHRIEGLNYNDASGVKLFTDGPPGTRIDANWLNSIQEELMYLITQAGLTPLESATDTWHQLYEALGRLFEQEPYISTMTAHETFISGSSYSRRRKYLLNPNGADRNFNPSGTFPTGYEGIFINTGVAFNVVVDSTGAGHVVTPGSIVISIYDGTNWL